MKRILFVLSSMRLGGVEKSFLALLASFPREGWQVDVLLLEKTGELLEELPSWVRVLEAPWYEAMKRPLLAPPRQVVQQDLRMGRIKQALTFSAGTLISTYSSDRTFFYRMLFSGVPELEEDYDTVVAYQGPTDILDYYVAKKVNARRKIGWVHFDVGSFPVNRRLYQRLYAEYDHIFVVSRQAERHLIATLKTPELEKKTSVFYTPLPAEQIRRQAEEKGFSGEKQGMRLVTVGRLSEEKGPYLALEAAAQLKKEGIAFCWYWVGDGPERDKVEEEVRSRGLADCFQLLGRQKNPYPFVGASDIYIQPSLHEGFCLTLAEAKLLGRPIVTTDFTGAAEQIRSYFDGVVVRKEPRELSSAIRMLIDNPRQRERLSEQVSYSRMASFVDLQRNMRELTKTGGTNHGNKRQRRRAGV
ncbi:glycosyltransferase [Alkalicoccus chagannorensis]|uniref:glycosyltransferase n=1 Tax=Alkalicoccus chagannorensis TaxID=427072 RepID=UPI0003FF072F|nr:glycosyltransferase [Alkalicoccus chagannorensis]